MFCYINEIESQKQVQQALGQGAGAIGIKIGYGEHKVPPESARELFLSCPLFIGKVGVFAADTPRYEVEELITFCKLDVLHFTQIPADISSYRTAILLEVGEKEIQFAPADLAGYIVEKPLSFPFPVAETKIWQKGNQHRNLWQKSGIQPYGCVKSIEEL